MYTLWILLKKKYRVDICERDPSKWDNPIIDIDIFENESKLTINNWVLIHMKWNENWNNVHDTYITCKTPLGITHSFHIPKEFSFKILKSSNGIIEKKIEEAYEFLSLISQFENDEDLKFFIDIFNKAKDIKKAMKAFIELREYHSHIPTFAKEAIERKITECFNDYLSKQEN